MRKIFLGIFLLTFITLLVSLVGMRVGNKHTFEEMHEIVGAFFIVLICFHIFFHRAVIKNLFHK